MSKAGYVTSNQLTTVLAIVRSVLRAREASKLYDFW